MMATWRGVGACAEDGTGCAIAINRRSKPA
jgi:hypothetical protein